VPPSPLTACAAWRQTDSVRHIEVAERRARLAKRHSLAPGAHVSSVVDAAAAMVGLHATDPATVFLSVVARVPKANVASIERELYDDRSVVRMLGMRRTMFVVPADAVGVIDAACTRAIAARERARLVKLVEDAGIAKAGARWVKKVEVATLAALARRGAALASELSQDVPELRQTILYGAGSKWETVQTVSTRLITVLAADGSMIRGKPRGSWVSSQYRWYPPDAWLGAPVEDVPVDAARAELARRWLKSFGPGTAEDLKWWTGWTLGETRKALAGVGAVQVGLDGGTGYVLAGDDAPAKASKPWVALLPALDPTPMGWKEREWYLGPHTPALVDRSGNIGPTVWCDGRIVGGWAQRKDGAVVYRLLEDIGAAAASAVKKKAAQLADWFGGVVVATRFPSPLERELKA
jgi:hypothetical protein